MTNTFRKTKQQMASFSSKTLTEENVKSTKEIRASAAATIIASVKPSIKITPRSLT